MPFGCSARKSLPEEILLFVFPCVLILDGRDVSDCARIYKPFIRAFIMVSKRQLFLSKQDVAWDRISKRESH